MQKVFNYYTDPGHGWVKVPLKVLKELNIVDKITSYSYMKGDYAYLEEDLDASTFVDAMRNRNIEPKFRLFNARERESKIRNYYSYFSKYVN